MSHPGRSLAGRAVAAWIAINLDFGKLTLEFWKAADPAAGPVRCS